MKSYVCITGATGGLGRSFAVECAQRGWDLFITDLSGETLKSLADGLMSAYGIDVDYYPCDLSDSESRTKLFDMLLSCGYSFRSLINIAGLDYEGPFAEKTREQIRMILRLNIEATLEMTHEIIKLRAKGEPFRVINVCSLAAYYPMPVKAMYAASKRFLLDFSLALGEEIRHLGGTVTALCPAGMPTNEECIKSIEAQGFMGWATTKNVGFVASSTIDHALKGHAVYVPGRINRIIRIVGSLVPPRLIARLIGRRWQAAYQKSSVVTV